MKQWGIHNHQYSYKPFPAGAPSNFPLPAKHATFWLPVETRRVDSTQYKNPAWTSCSNHRWEFLTQSPVEFSYKSLVQMDSYWRNTRKNSFWHNAEINPRWWTPGILLLLLVLLASILTIKYGKWFRSRFLLYSGGWFCSPCSAIIRRHIDSVVSISISGKPQYLVRKQ